MSTSWFVTGTGLSLNVSGAPRNLWTMLNKSASQTLICDRISMTLDSITAISGRKSWHDLRRVTGAAITSYSSLTPVRLDPTSSLPASYDAAYDGTLTGTFTTLRSWGFDWEDAGSDSGILNLNTLHCTVALSLVWDDFDAPGEAVITLGQNVAVNVFHHGGMGAACPGSCCIAGVFTDVG